MKLWPETHYLLVEDSSFGPTKKLINIETITTIDIESKPGTIHFGHEWIRVKEDDLKRVLQALGIED